MEFTDGESIQIGSLQVTPREVVHPSGAPPFALCVTIDEATIAYSGDTEWTDALVDIARGADLFLCEAYYYDKDIPYHLSYERLCAEYDDLNAERVVLTHMSDDMLGRHSEIGLETAADGAEYTL